MAIFIPGPAVLVVGDYLSPLEIPMISPGGSLAAYQATLDRLEPLIARAQWVVPGHGAPLPAAKTSQILAEDRAYLAGLGLAGAPRSYPKGEQAPGSARSTRRTCLDWIRTGLRSWIQHGTATGI